MIIAERNFLDPNTGERESAQERGFHVGPPKSCEGHVNQIQGLASTRHCLGHGLGDPGEAGGSGGLCGGCWVCAVISIPLFLIGTKLHPHDSLPVPFQSRPAASGMEPGSPDWGTMFAQRAWGRTALGTGASRNRWCTQNWSLGTLLRGGPSWMYWPTSALAGQHTEGSATSCCSATRLPVTPEA